MTLPVLETARLELAPWHIRDIDALHALWTDADVRRWLWDGEIISREQAESTVLASIREAEESGIGMWCVRLRGKNEVIGFCGFRSIEDTRDIELMYGFLPAHWRQGLATESARAALAYGFRSGLFQMVYGRTDVPNQASVRVLERLGMKLEGQIMIGDLPAFRYSLDRSSFLDSAF